MKPKIKTTCTKLQLQLLSFCLLCLSGKTRCDGNGPAVVTVEQDSDAVLPCSLSPKENIELYLFDWKKPAQIDGGQKKVFYYDAGVNYDSGRAGQSEEFKGRVSHFPEELKHGNASIIIRNTMVPDSGNYTCVFPRLQPPQTFHIKLVVEPVVVRVKEDGDALLPCSLSTKGNIEQGHFDWNKVAQNNEKQKEVFQYDKRRHSNNGFGSQDDGFKGRVSHFQEELKHGNASIIIRNTTVADSGDYTCTFTEPRKTFHIELDVGAASKPNIRTLDETDNRALLQCEVHGHPEPEVEWRDSAGKTLPAQKSLVKERGKFFITLNTTVTKTDRYRCVATQKEISHQLSTETIVRLNGPAVVTVEQGRDAVLPCSLSPKENIESYRFDWKKPAQIDGGQKEVFYYDAGITYDNGYPGQSEEFKGRVSHFPEELKHGDASIIIRNTKMADSGDYTCSFPNLQPPQTFHIELVVEPVVVKVEEGRDALLPCSLSTKENISQGHFDWNKLAQNDEKQKEVFLYLNGRHSNNGFGSQDDGFKRRVSHFQEELKDGNASIIIRNTKMADSGNYTCTFTEPRQTFHIKLDVGACPKPYLRILGPTKDGVLLQCEVQGASPKPKVELKDSSGNKLPAEDRGGSYDIILQTTVTKTDNYSCVSTQDGICHQISAYTHVPVNVNSGSGAHNSGSSTAWIVVGVLCTVIVIVGGGGGAALWRHKKKTPNKGSPADENAGSAVPLKSQPSQSQEAPDPDT